MNGPVMPCADQGTIEHPITWDDMERDPTIACLYQHCRCNTCGKVSQCTLHNGFFLTAKDRDNFACSSCWRATCAAIAGEAIRKFQRLRSQKLPPLN